MNSIKKVFLLISLFAISNLSFAECFDLNGSYILETSDESGRATQKVFVSLKSANLSTNELVYNVYDSISIDQNNVLFNYRVTKKVDGACSMIFNDNWSDFWVYPGSTKSFREFSEGKIYKVYSFLRSKSGGVDSNKTSLYRLKKEISLYPPL